MDESFLRGKLGESYSKLAALNSERINEFVERFIRHCSPNSVYVFDNSKRGEDYIRGKAIEAGEESKLTIKGHTVHFDGYDDQGRDTRATRYLLPEGWDLGELKSVPKDEGLAEILGHMKDSMRGKEMLVLFFTLGPEGSVFSIPSVQITDSYYVAHSEMLLYRGGYEHFKKMRGKGDFFRFAHSAGELVNHVSKNTDRRRVYIDLEENTIYSVNTQYGGNTIGLKKLAMRLAIQKACSEDWLTEHMFIMGVHGPGGRVTYFTGAFPSACGKTATSMMKGETIVGDDIAYLRVIDGKVRTVNVEKGLFGIITDVNEKDDPVIYKALTTPREVIFSNVLVDGKSVPHWLGDGREAPAKGRNHSGEWHEGKRDREDKEIPLAHKNARYTIGIGNLDNKDPLADDPKGVEVGGVIYGGRDSDTTVPVEEAYDWNHGILTKAVTIESETTSATLGQEGVRAFQPMSNLDFVSVPLGRYVKCNLAFGHRAKKAPKIFSVNYFQRDKDGRFMTTKDDKRVWAKWMELRVHGDVDAIKTPTGHIPKYEDLKRLFKEVLGREYHREQYDEQFKVRVLEHLAKIDRIEAIFRQKVPDAPAELYKALDEQRKRLEAAKARHGDYILPGQLQ